MKIKREELAKTLRNLGPTLGEKTPLEQLKCFWFDANNGRAWTYNEVVATEVPFDVGLSGGITAHLSGIIENSTADDIDLTIAGHELTYSFGGTKGSLTTHGMGEAIYPFPPDDAARTAIVGLTGDAEAALRHVNTNASESGVTLIAEEDELSFYSTDNKSISWARIPLPDGYNAPRLLLSPQFCQRLQVAMEGSGAILEILGDSVIAVLESNMRLFGRITIEEHPRPFREAVKRHIPEDGTIDVPGGMAEALKRIHVLVQPGKKARMRVALGAGEIRFEFKSDYGHLDERFAVKPGKHSVEAYFDPELLNTGFAMAAPSVIAIGEHAFTLLTDKNFGYIATSSSKPD